jgi:hypothetical protein
MVEWRLFALRIIIGIALAAILVGGFAAMIGVLSLAAQYAG